MVGLSHNEMVSFLRMLIGGAEPHALVSSGRLLVGWRTPATSSRNSDEDTFIGERKWNAS